MKNFIFLLFFLCFHTANIGHCFSMPQALPIQESIAMSKNIVVAELESFVVSPEYKAPEGFADGIEGVLALTIIKPPGKAVFRVLYNVKGKAPDTLSINLPFISSYYYSGNKFDLKQGTTVLLFLSPLGNTFVPTDNIVPLIPLAKEWRPKRIQLHKKSTGDKVAFLLNQSMADSLIKRINAFFLRSFTSAQLPPLQAPYVEDLDWQVRDDVLYSMSVNQQISAIPRIAKIEKELFAEGKSASSIESFAMYKSSSAVPYLNPVLLHTSTYARMHTVWALSRLANTTSIPYLILGLQDPDEVIQCNAYRKIHKLVSDLGVPGDCAYFRSHLVTEKSRIYTWWKNELLGKHFTSNLQKPASVSALLYTRPLNKVSPLTIVNPLLFQPFVTTREEAVSYLEKNADYTSVPYLILALRDPSISVAYKSYGILNRILPKIGEPLLSKTKFLANRQKASRPFNEWWHAELNGKHIKKS